MTYLAILIAEWLERVNKSMPQWSLFRSARQAVWLAVPLSPPMLPVCSTRRTRTVRQARWWPGPGLATPSRGTRYRRPLPPRRDLALPPPCAPHLCQVAGHTVRWLLWDVHSPDFSSASLSANIEPLRGICAPPPRGWNLCSFMLRGIYPVWKRRGRMAAAKELKS